MLLIACIGQHAAAYLLATSKTVGYLHCRYRPCSHSSPILNSSSGKAGAFNMMACWCLQCLQAAAAAKFQLMQHRVPSTLSYTKCSAAAVAGVSLACVQWSASVQCYNPALLAGRWCAEIAAGSGAMGTMAGEFSQPQLRSNQLVAQQSLRQVAAIASKCGNRAAMSR